MDAQAQEAESLLAQSLTKNDALRNAIRAAELYLGAARCDSRESERNRLRAKCNELLSKAEEIRNSSDWPLKTKESTKKCLIAPVSLRKITLREKLILLESSKLNGFLFPPWITNPDDDILDNVTEGQIHEPHNLKLSQEQKSIFSGWKRPSECKGYNLNYNDQPPLMSSEKDFDLVQDTIPDCSVVSSLCAIVSRASKGHGQLISSVIHPINKQGDGPAISVSGKYIFRFHFNGCFRKVIIDDRLPVSNTQRSLHLIDRNNPRLLWPALVEKAYLKVRGGYDFPGSNSGTDLWVITGWIPEQISLQSDYIELEQLWCRVYQAFGYGDVMITLGTGKLSFKEMKEFGLAGEHDYAVMDMDESDSQRLLIKNPWRDGMIWKPSNEKPVAQQNSQDKKFIGDRHNSSKNLSTVSSGIFWMKFQSVAQYFDYMYLNWNPGLFRYRQDHHFSWEIPRIQVSGSLITNPQYRLRSSNKETLWVLLSRHFSTEEQDISVSIEKPEAQTSIKLGYLSLYIFETNGHKVYMKDGAFYRGNFVDSPQTLAKFDVSPSATYTIVAAQQNLLLPKYSFTLTFFSRFPLEIGIAEYQLNYFSKHNGAWNFRTAGGNVNCSSYPENPQYYISFNTEADIELFLEADQQDLAIHVNMVWAGGERVTAITSKDIVGDSGDYRHGYTLALIKSVPAGKYTIVCSTFESGKVGDFTLHVGASAPCLIKPVLSEKAGRLSLKLPLLVFTENIDRMLAPIALSRLTKLRVIAKSKLASDNLQIPISRPLLKILLEKGRGPDKFVLAKSSGGEFSDAPMGVRLGDVNLSPDLSQKKGLWVIVERLSGRKMMDSVEIEVLSDIAVTVGPWDTDSG